MAKLRGSTESKLNAIAETLRLVAKSSTDEKQLREGIDSVIKMAEAWANKFKRTTAKDLPDEQCNHDEHSICKECWP